MQPLDVSLVLHAIWHRAIGGTESAIYNLAKGLSREPDCSLELLTPDPRRFSPEFRTWLAGYRGRRVTYGLPGPRPVRYVEEWLAPSRATGRDWIVFPNYFMPLRSSKTRPRRTAILHDIQYKTYPDFVPHRRRAWLDLYLPRMFEAADAVLLVSAFEKEQVAHFFGSSAADKCRVVSNGIDFERFDTGDIRPAVAARLERDFLLAVSHPFPHKNLATLLAAFEIVGERRPHLHLHLAGAAAGTHDGLVGRIASPRVRERVVQLGYLSDREIGACYRGCRLFVHPSLYEGFGMPVVEALGLGVQVVASRAAAIPEVSLGLASYVDDPLSPAEWAAQIERALDRAPRTGGEAAERIRNVHSTRAVAARVVSQLRAVDRA